MSRVPSAIFLLNFTLYYKIQSGHSEAFRDEGHFSSGIEAIHSEEEFDELFDGMKERIINHVINYQANQR